MDTGKVTAAPARMPPVRTRLPGNQALLRLQRKCACGGEETCSSCQIQTRRIQTKVVVGTVDDPLEMEADAVADRVMRMPETNPVKPSSAGLQIQRACAACEHEEEDVVRRMLRQRQRSVPHRPGKRRHGRRRYSWAELLRRVFLIDVLVCPHCGGRRRLLAAIHDPESIRRCWGDGLPSTTLSGVRGREVELRKNGESPQSFGGSLMNCAAR